MLDQTSRDGQPIARHQGADPHSSSQPIPLFGTKSKAEPYPIEALGPFAGPVTAILEDTQSPDAIPAQCVLSAASLATQHLANVETLGGVAPISLFFLTVAESGERKSACHNIAMRAIKDLERARLRDFQSQKDTSSEVVETPPVPLRPHMLFNDPTIEGLMRHFREGQPSVGIFSDEAGQILGGSGMSHENKLKSGAAFSKLWDGNPLDRARAGGEPPETFYDRRAALHLMIQPVVADRQLSDPVLRGQGLFARMLIAEPESRIGSRFFHNNQAPSNSSALAHFDARLQALLETEAANRDRATVRPRDLPLSGGARDLLIRFYNDTEAAQAVGGELFDIRGTASKAAENACRLAAVMTLYQVAKATSFDTQAMENAITLMTWYLNEAHRLLTAANIPETLLEAETLRVWLVQKHTSSTVTIRDAQRKGPSRLRSAPKLKEIFAILQENHWLLPEPVNGGKSWYIAGRCDGF